MDVSIEQEQKGIANFITKYSIAIASVLGTAVVVLIILAIYTHIDHKDIQADATATYRFEQTSLTNYVNGKINGDQLASDFEKLFETTEEFDGIVPAAVVTADLLFAKNDSANAKKVLEPVAKVFDSSYQGFYVRSRLAVACENLQDYNCAKTEYEWLIASGIDVMMPKHYTDAARMNLELGDKEKAIALFKHVVEKYKASEFFRIAQNYLAELGAK